MGGKKALLDWPTKDLRGASPEHFKPNSSLQFTQVSKRDFQANSGPTQADKASLRAARGPLKADRMPSSAEMDSLNLRKALSGQLMGLSGHRRDILDQKSLSDRKRVLSGRHRALSGGKTACWADGGPFKSNVDHSRLKKALSRSDRALCRPEKVFSCQH